MTVRLGGIPLRGILPWLGGLGPVGPVLLLVGIPVVGVRLVWVVGLLFVGLGVRWGLGLLPLKKALLGVG